MPVGIAKDAADLKTANLEQTVDVFYVTATTSQSAQDESAVHAAVIRAATSGATVAPDGVQTKARHELAKFFSLSDAENHAPKIGRGWLDVRIEKRTEKMKDQHMAHLLGPTSK
jgi:hypothetical protein